MPNVEFVTTFLALMSADGFECLGEEFQDDKFDPSLRSTVILGKIPARFLIKFCYSH